MASSHFIGFVTLIYLGVLSGSAAGWFWWPNSNPNSNSGDSWIAPDGCQDVYDYYISCEDYIVGSNQYPGSNCCNGLNYLNQIAKNEADGAGRICQCIEAIAARGGHPRYSEGRIKNLYYSCNIHLSFPISEHMDCSRIY